MKRFVIQAAAGILCLLFFSSCARKMGWGLLLWSTEEPEVPSGTVLPVYIRSNIDKVWVAGIPKEYRSPGSTVDKFEIPLSKLELLGSRKKALARAESFAPFALTYAETLQDGLPIREDPENNARRVYRLRMGEIIKILSPVEGIAAVGSSGDPLPGEWYYVLTEDGATGYCFSYRLRLFEYTGGALVAVGGGEAEAEDPELDRVLSLTWSPEVYGDMVSTRRIDLDDFSKHWIFDPGADTGTARIYTKDIDRIFTYTGIHSLGGRSWRFEGTDLLMSLRGDTTLAVQFNETGGLQKTLLFVALPQPVDDIIVQETSRREELFGRIYAQGPVFTSHNYGTLSFSRNGRFTWTGYDLLVPAVIPASALESGAAILGLFLDSSLEERYNGGIILRFDRAGGSGAPVYFLYSLDGQGLRLEYVPPANLDGVTVIRRAPSPRVIYFYKSDVSSQAESGPALRF